MKRIKLVVAYDGTNYCGWQVQPNGMTVEEMLNQTITKVMGTTTKVVGASRTDSGVHALGNVAVFDTECTIPGERVKHALNQHLPEDIRIIDSDEVAAGFHPRFCETAKTYEYAILTGKSPYPTYRHTHYFVSYALNTNDMRKAAEYIVGTHDFTSFCSSKSEVEDRVRTIYSLDIVEEGRDNAQIKFIIKGNGFLYNMVRIIVGTLIDVGRGLIRPEDVEQILEAKDRTKAGATAPAQGLCLVEIKY